MCIVYFCSENKTLRVLEVFEHEDERDTWTLKSLVFIALKSSSEKFCALRRVTVFLKSANFELFLTSAVFRCINPWALTGPYISVTTLFYGRFAQDTKPRPLFYRKMSRFGQPCIQLRYFHCKWSLQGPVRTKILVDCKLPRVKGARLCLGLLVFISFCC